MLFVLVPRFENYENRRKLATRMFEANNVFVTKKKYASNAPPVRNSFGRFSKRVQVEGICTVLNNS